MFLNIVLCFIWPWLVMLSEPNYDWSRTMIYTLVCCGANLIVYSIEYGSANLPGPNCLCIDFRTIF